MSSHLITDRVSIVLFKKPEFVIVEGDLKNRDDLIDSDSIEINLKDMPIKVAN